MGDVGLADGDFEESANATKKSNPKEEKVGTFIVVTPFSFGCLCRPENETDAHSPEQKAALHGLDSSRGHKTCMVSKPLVTHDPHDADNLSSLPHTLEMSVMHSAGQFGEGATGVGAGVAEDGSSPSQKAALHGSDSSRGHKTCMV